MDIVFRRSHNRDLACIHVDGAVVAYTHCLDVFARRIRLCTATIVDSRQNLPWRKQTGSDFWSGSPSVLRDFLVVCCGLRLAQSVLPVRNTGDRTGKSLPVCCRYGKTLGRDYCILEQSKFPHRPTGNRSETPQLVTSRQVGKPLETVGT